jgi:hypothetical protein
MPGPAASPWQLPFKSRQCHVAARCCHFFTTALSRVTVASRPFNFTLPSHCTDCSAVIVSESQAPLGTECHGAAGAQHGPSPAGAADAAMVRPSMPAARSKMPALPQDGLACRRINLVLLRCRRASLPGVPADARIEGMQNFRAALHAPAAGGDCACCRRRLRPIVTFPAPHIPLNQSIRMACLTPFGTEDMLHRGGGACRNGRARCPTQATLASVMGKCARRQSHRLALSRFHAALAAHLGLLPV